MRDRAKERIGHTSTPSWGNGGCDRLDLGTSSHSPEPSLRHRDATGAIGVAREEERQGGVRGTHPWFRTMRRPVDYSSSPSAMTLGKAPSTGP